MYAGQKIHFLNSVRAQIQAIYRQGKRVSSGFFANSTKPIFRSVSARYVIFLQMSKEMWDFEPEGSGELMSNKIIDGFLPELFTKWHNSGARHLLSIVLFTRLEYEKFMLHDRDLDSKHGGCGTSSQSKAQTHQDFYRVLICDMASHQWPAILVQLKKDFKDFLRDVSIFPASKSGNGESAEGGKVIDSTAAGQTIAGRPVPAARGNILEALNLASSQFSQDHVNRDLMRTGLSIVVITPGTGVFEVNAKLLALTTNLLIENGVGIDLVCLSRMPLHSVPLFKYRSFKTGNQRNTEKLAQMSHVQANTTSDGFLGNTTKQFDQDNEPNSDQSFLPSGGSDEWNYAIPHWVDISFWNRPVPPSGQNYRLGTWAPSRSKIFVPRIKMYEIQMMGIMQNEMCDVSISHLPASAVHRNKNGPAQVNTLQARGSVSSNYMSFSRNKTPLPTASDSVSPSPSPRSPISLGSSKTRALLLQQIEDHDNDLFNCPVTTQSVESTLHTNDIQRLPFCNGIDFNSKAPPKVDHTAIPRKTEEYSSERDVIKAPRGGQRSEGLARKVSMADNAASFQAESSTLRKVSRPGSFGFRGFGGQVSKALPVTEVSSEVAHRQSLLARSHRRSTLHDTEEHSSWTTGKSVKAYAPRGTTSIFNGARETLVQSGQHSKPINIKSQNAGFSVPNNNDMTEQNSQQTCSPSDSIDLQGQLESRSPLEQQGEAKPMTPWLTILNPSNPKTTRVDPNSRLGRWHHVFPRPLHASSMKWKSLCSPASIPLTTDSFPSSEQFPAEYEASHYRIAVAHPATHTSLGSPVKLISEMIYMRFSRGFQIVVGSHMSASPRDISMHDFGIFDEARLSEPNISIFMSRGASIHHLSKIDEYTVEVKLYLSRHLVTLTSSPSVLSSYDYQPKIRTPLSSSYEPHRIKIPLISEPLDWRRLDALIAGHRESLQPFSDSGAQQSWEARYVFIPVHNASSDKRTLKANEDNDEEVRLEGIYKLTQLWKKNMWEGPSGDSFPIKDRKVESLNPLDIVFRTHSASTVVASELHETLLVTRPNEDLPGDLLPESELFDRRSLNLSILAQALQGSQGVRLRDRRWHWRLHYNCFIGIELVTWLLERFRDVNSREESVDLGNELMQKGLFIHVEKRHDFRDGNFFYQLHPEYRIPRTETRSTWFNRLSSVPSTPIVEKSRGDTASIGSQASDDDGKDAPSPVLTEKAPATKVTLSKTLLYDADRRKKSYRSEVFNLHYDRISSADDCYHVRVDWLNVTPKLIEDAVSSWASAAERFNLRLVELPVQEASRVNEQQAFKIPYTIKLSKKPPGGQGLGPFRLAALGTGSAGGHPYHRALLKKFDFVLDMEAAKDFPPTVEVLYSWGRPNYRYPQYIARDGVLLAQITDDGDILLIPNTLFNHSSGTGRKTEPTGREALLGAPDSLNHKSPLMITSSRSSGTPSTSPYTSPTLRATTDTGSRTTTANLYSPNIIKTQLEAFCSDPQALEAFYKDVLSAASLESPRTPPVEGLDNRLIPPTTLALGR